MMNYAIFVFNNVDTNKVIDMESAMRSDIAHERYRDLVDRYPHNIVRLCGKGSRTPLAETIPAT